MPSIPFYTEINQLFEAKKFEQRTDIPEFIIYKFRDMPQDKGLKMALYRKNFFQISLITQGHCASVSIDNQYRSTLSQTIYFLSPDHVFAWERSPQTEGYIVYFKENFLNFYGGSFILDFYFFHLADRNIISLSDEETAQIVQEFEKLYQEFHTEFKSCNHYCSRYFLSLEVCTKSKRKHLYPKVDTRN
ncbi:MAG: hypothetical protein OHK0053_05120 [Microscillaceae bacterium]